MERRTHFKVARRVERHDTLANTLDAICAEQIPQDFSSGVLMPVMNGSEEHLLRGAPRYKIIRSLTLPIVDLVRPEPPYGQVFKHAALRFDDGSKTVDAQVSKKIATRWSEMFPEGTESDRIVESKGVVADFTERGYRLSAQVEEGQGYEIDYDAVQEFLAYIGRFKAYRGFDLDFRSLPDTKFVPKIPLVSFNLDVSDSEVGYVHEQFQSELPILFRVGELMSPKVY